MTYRVLCVAGRSDLPESELFVRLRRAGVDLEVACNPTGPNYWRLRRAGVPVHDLVIRGRVSPRAIRALRRILADGGFDIVYCFNNRALSNLLLAGAGRRERVVSYRGTVGNLGLLTPGPWTSHLHPRVSRIVCVSEAVRRHLLGLRLAGWRMPPDKPVTIHKGHDPEWYTDPADPRAELGLPRDAFLVGFAGRNRPHKGLADLLESARHLPEDAPVHFLLLGRLHGDRKLDRRIAASPAKARMHRLGFRRDAPAVLAACDIVVMPSTEREGLPRTVLEAMSSGVPPIVTDVGGQPELVVDGDSGLVVPPRDPAAIAAAIRRLHDEPATRRAMGERAYQRIATTFHVDETVRRTIAMFEALIAEGRA